MTPTPFARSILRSGTQPKSVEEMDNHPELTADDRLEYPG